MTTRRVVGNASALFVARVVAGGAAVAVAVVVARRLGAEGFGTFVAITAGGFIVNTAITFGTDTVVVRAVAADDGSRSPTAHAALRIQLLSSLLVVAAAAVGTAIVGRDAVPIAIQALGLVPLAFGTVATAVLRGIERMHLQLIATTVSATVSFAAVLMLLEVSSSVSAAVAGVVIGQSLGAVVATVLAVGRVRYLRPDGVLPLGSLLRETWVFALMVVLTAAATHGGVLLFEAFDRDVAAGGYGAAHRVIELVRLGPAALFGALFPVMVRGELDAIRTRRLLRLLSIGGVVATIVLLVSATLITDALFDEFPDDAATLRVLALSVVPVIWRLHLSFALIATGRERDVLRAAALGLVAATGVGVVAAHAASSPGMAAAQLVGIVTQIIALGVLASRSADDRSTAVAG